MSTRRQVFRKTLVLLLGGGISLTLSSCALMFNGTTKSVSIKSMTQDSSIYVDGNYVGEDCAAVDLKRNKQHVVLVKKKGHKTEIVNIGNNVQVGWIVFDALFNWFAFLTDPTTGAWYGLDRKNIVVKLVPLKEGNGNE
ncbi:MAG: PEGA domain-containing protein [Endomicrobium sp.]|nr:PEGA domain-containing protein [Endomicrobium sp.]